MHSETDSGMPERIKYVVAKNVYFVFPSIGSRFTPLLRNIANVSRGTVSQASKPWNSRHKTNWGLPISIYNFPNRKKHPRNYSGTSCSIDKILFDRADLMTRYREGGFIEGS